MSSLATVRVKPQATHLYTLDVLRGVGALIVILFHWSHFFTPDTFIPQRLPAFVLLKPFYVHGWRAVDMFFSLSGFVFYWLYAESILTRQMSAIKFAILRFSRLYPLHFVTLLVVATEQILFHAHYGRYFVYFHNNLFHFVLQIFLMNDWGFEQGFSFNGPSWSISVEMLLYTVFFMVCALRLTKTWHIAILTLVSLVIYHLSGRWADELGRGLSCFFIGGLSYRLYLFLRTKEIARKYLFLATLILAVSWVLLTLGRTQPFLLHAYARSPLPSRLTWHGHDLGEFAIVHFFGNSYNMLLVPATLVMATLLESHGIISVRRFIFVGDLSFSSYLLHFPLQIIFYTIVVSMGWGEAWFYTPIAFLIFFSVLIPLSLASHYYFERPVQGLIRRRWSGKGPATASKKTPATSASA